MTGNASDLESLCFNAMPMPVSSLEDYLESHSTPAGDVADAVERWAHLHTAQPQMVCGPYEGRLLSLLCRTVRPQCAVEVGSFVGYSTLLIATAMPPGGRLHTFEVNDERKETILRHLEQAQVSHAVDLHIGDALTLIPTLFEDNKRTIDFAFIDADKRSQQDYYDLLVPRMRPGALLLVDNALWGRKVLDLQHNHDRDTLTVHAFNEYVQHDARVENIMLDVRDGLLICSVL